MRKISAWIYKALEIAGGLLIGALVILIGIEVFFRYVVGNALSWPEEVCGFIFVWATMIGAVLCAKADSHAAVTVVLNLFPVRLRKLIRISLQIIVLVYGYLMITQGVKIMSLFGFEKSPAAGISLVWEYSSIPVAGVFLIFYASLKIFATLVGDEK